MPKERKRQNKRKRKRQKERIRQKKNKKKDGVKIRCGCFYPIKEENRGSVANHSYVHIENTSSPAWPGRLFGGRTVHNYLLTTVALLLRLR